MFGSLSPTQQNRTRYTTAAGYSKELALSFLLWQVAKFVALVSVAVPLVGFFGYLWSHGVTHPLQALRAVLNPVLVLCWLALMFALTVFLGTFTMMYWALTDTKRAGAKALDQHGVITQGVVIDQWEEQSGNESGAVYSYLAYRYGSYTLKQKVSKKLYRQYGVGTSVRVRYLPSNPSIARLEDV